MAIDRYSYPFTAIVDQDEMKLALVLNAINPSIGGVLIRGEKGTAKSTAVRALARLLPGYDSISRLHGKVIVKDGVTYIPIYHPAAALYNSFLMGPLEQDFKAVKAHLDRMEERRKAVAAATAPLAKPEEQLTLFG